ncbi:dihydroxyacetone kinase subunit DhaL [Lichenibacterium dinghuense]|uniref:dihydroxyacetone kinase subunit DhaL n=1 Tax=Lichenibacterium dinghuense TaxID=2895977 RepID=UPI001F00FEF7|nr:dihydroxyacetone kinase subunit DhaL [Lichenibacterium sp. 6Y81]
MREITAGDLVRALGAVRDAIEAEKGELCRLDGVIGDADHGIGMALGFAAVSRALEASPPADPAGVFAAAARSFLDAVGASTGPLYATAFLRAAAAVKGRAALGRDDVVGALAAMAKGVADRGKAQPGEKTMLDAWAPAAAAAERAAAAGSDLQACLRAAAEAAAAGAEATKAMAATKGRASRLGERALGHVDPGAASAAIILRVLAEGL